MVFVSGGCCPLTPPLPQLSTGSPERSGPKTFRATRHHTSDAGPDASAPDTSALHLDEHWGIAPLLLGLVPAYRSPPELGESASVRAARGNYGHRAQQPMEA